MKLSESTLAPNPISPSLGTLLIFPQITLLSFLLFFFYLVNNFNFIYFK